MANALTYENILELIAETEISLKKQWEESNKQHEERLKKEEQARKKAERSFKKQLEESNKQHEERLKKEEQAMKKSREEFEKRLKREALERKKSRKEFNKKIGELTGTLGRFVEGLVEPKLLEMFQQIGIGVTDVFHNVEIHDLKGQRQAQIDLLLINSTYSVAVEVKTTLNTEAVDEHIRRLDKLQKNPKRYLKGTILLGAVAGMRVVGNADRYAYKNGLYVLKQKGEIVEIVNDVKFSPREWIIK